MNINFLHKCVLGVDVDIIEGHTEYCVDGRGVLPSCEGHTLVRVAKPLTPDQEAAVESYNRAANGFGSIEVVEEA